MRGIAALALLIATSTASAQPAATPPRSPGEPPPQPVVVRHSRTPALIATGVTAALAITTVAVYIHRDHLADTNPIDGATCTTPECAYQANLEHEHALAEIDRYKNYLLVSTAATVVSGAVTAYLWSRVTERSYTVAPAVTVGERSGGLLVSGRF